jgi:anthranilate synthase component 2
MRLLLLDNYDSFTYNLLHLVEKVSDYEVDVFKNDQITLDEINKYQKIILSPGPGLPIQAGIMPDLLKAYADKKSILGVCLGMQAIAERFNSPLKNLQTVYHGVATSINILSPDIIFNNCPPSFLVGRYHSWVVDENKISNELIVTAEDSHKLIMAIKHPKYDIKGVQFHPESILSEYGEVIMKNWLSI